MSNVFGETIASSPPDFFSDAPVPAAPRVAVINDFSRDPRTPVDPRFWYEVLFTYLDAGPVGETCDSNRAIESAACLRYRESASSPLGRH